jgi:preprotein translocase subunit SecG
METMVAIIHIVVALVLISLILLQDSKAGMGGAFGGGGSNSVLGATGGATLAQKATRIAAVVFALTSIALTIFSSRAHKSVIDDVVTNAPPAATAPAAAPAEPAAPAPAGTPAETK